MYLYRGSQSTKKNHFPKIILLTSADLKWGVVKGKNGKKLMATQFRD